MHDRNVVSSVTLPCLPTPVFVFNVGHCFELDTLPYRNWSLDGASRVPKWRWKIDPKRGQLPNPKQVQQNLETAFCSQKSLTVRHIQWGESEVPGKRESRRERRHESASGSDPCAKTEGTKSEKGIKLRQHTKEFRS